MRLVFAAIALAACAPVVDGPIDRQRTRDREDGERLRAQVAALPGVERAEVVLQRPARDPLANRAPAKASLSIVGIVDDKADRAAVTEAARRLAKALAPEAEPTLVVEVGAARPELAHVGPFEVVAGHKRALQATLAAMFVALAGLAVFAAVRYRRGNSAQ